MSIDLSIVIPVWNEASKIGTDIKSVDRFFSESGLSGELIIADDGSTDGTAGVAKGQRSAIRLPLRVIENECHRGKGFTVKSGVLASSGQIVMFMDCGGNVPLKYIRDGIDLLAEKNCNMAFGSRHHKQSSIVKNLIWYRRITSFLFRKFVKLYLNIPPHITDTQCGFKLFDGEIAREVFAQCTTDGFLFDLEILFLALQRNQTIAEFPIEWRCDRDSRLSVSGNFRNVLSDLKILKNRYHR